MSNEHVFININVKRYTRDRLFSLHYVLFAKTNVCEAVGQYYSGTEVSKQSCFKNAVTKIDSLYGSSVS
jgi:hypothetical protein